MINIGKTMQYSYLVPKKKKKLTKVCNIHYYMYIITSIFMTYQPGLNQGIYVGW